MKARTASSHKKNYYINSRFLWSRERQKLFSLSSTRRKNCDENFICYSKKRTRHKFHFSSLTRHKVFISTFMHVCFSLNCCYLLKLLVFFFFFFFFFFLLFGIVGVRVHFPGWRGWGIGVKASATVAGSQQGNEVWNGIARLISKCSRKWNSICCTAKEHRSTGLKTG